ncbi:YdgH/BhsA/McbA-like domain containing protein, partial [Morganella morganii]
AIAKEAVKKDAASFFIVRNIFTNDGGNQLVTAYVYKADAPKRVLQTEEALIPADSDAGRAALAAGGEAAKQVEIPGVASSTDTAGNNVGRFFETQSSRSGRYTVTLPDGTQVQELNKASAAVMAPFDSVTFTGYYTTSPEVSYQVAKRAAAKGAKYYHITRQWQSSGGNVTISADLFK